MPNKMFFNNIRYNFHEENLQKMLSCQNSQYQSVAYPNNKSFFLYSFVMIVGLKKFVNIKNK